MKKPASLRAFFFCSDAVTRTRDPVINSHLLYRLSYVGMLNGR